MADVKRKNKKNLAKIFRKLGKAERRFEQALKRRAGLEAAPKTQRVKPYVHPWENENTGSPLVVDQLEKKHCCGCASCANACPKSAIKMTQDEEGFYYPEVDRNLCIECGLCTKKCPVLCEKPRNDKVEICYAQWSEDQTRRVSSSGGMFSELAGYALKKGGAVFGAAYDENMTVHHIMIEDETGLERLRGSKYVQSQTDDCFKQVKALLKAGRFVLYSGCPCQIAGLYAYLGGNDNENLLTVDLICHGTPSPGLFERYLKETYGKENIKDVRFRDKSAFGWSTHMNVYLEDGSEQRALCSKDPYYRMFLPCLAMRPFCSHCKFTGNPRVADFSIGDWWGIEKYDRSLNDGSGTSLVTLNNERARRVYARISPSFVKNKEFPLEQALPRNYTFDKPFKAHPARARFFHLLEIMPYDKAVRYALDYHFDVGIFGLWYGENYGSVLTYFGLVKVLESMGLSVCLIANPLGSDEGDMKEPTLFAKRQGFFITRRRPISGMGECNSFCDAFMVGSDQLWNPGLSIPYGHTYFLSFAAENKKRIAYGTSFGKGDYKIPERYKERSRWEFSKFDALSVRDDFSKQLLKDDYGQEAVKVLDPALLCGREEYSKLALTADPVSAAEGTLPDLSKGGYTFVYMLDPDENTKEKLACLAGLTNKPIIVAIDMNPRKTEENLAFFEGSCKDNVFVLDKPKVEQWLSCFLYADNVLTDSFHGTLFSHVFEKDFVALPNAGRGKERFTDALRVLGLTERILPDLDCEPEEIKKLLNTPVDYIASNRLLEKARADSFAWLKNALFAPKKIRTDRVYVYEETSAAKGE